MAKMSSKVGSRREIKKLPEHLWEGERVAMITSGTYGAGTGIVVLTDRRLFFLKDGLMSKTSEDFPLVKISSVQWSSGMLLGKIIVFAAGNKAEITNVQKADGKAITDALRAKLTESPQSGLESQQVSSPVTEDFKPDIYEQLAKLGELRNAGVLTDQEFETKKAELLNRI